MNTSIQNNTKTFLIGFAVYLISVILSVFSLLIFVTSSRQLFDFFPYTLFASLIASMGGFFLCHGEQNVEK